MANQFVLTAQIALQAPTNARQTLNQIQRQLQGVNVAVNLNSNPAQIKSLNQQLNSVNQSAKAASNSVSELGKTIGAAARRFGAISLATGTFLNLARAVKGSISDAIEFERQMIILAQTTEKSVRELGDLYREVTRLSTGLGVSSDGLIKTSIVLAQAGLEARKAKAALEVLAKTQLAASFDDIQSTTEGAIAILAQFRREAAGAGGDIKFLETSLEAINQVSKKYAVESSDLIAVIRRSGGAFEAAGGSLNELLALFTSVRATTRESAETISTGLRTIFTRIQRVDTIKQLKELGIALQDAEGKFVGPFEAIKRISEGLSSLDPRDFRFAQIVEELGGFRQIGKVIPLIKQFALAQEALNTAQSASGSLTKDTETAQLSLANKITKVKEEFQALIREFTQGEGFQSVARGALEFARALIRIADAIEPLLPLIASLGAIQIGRGLASALGAFSGFTRKNSGGKIMAFATGGMVPGTGNRDTVPAMLSPGEFVIRKSSVKKIGAENLQRLNRGGSVRSKKNKAFVFDFDDTLGETEAVVGGGANPYQNFRGAAAAKFVDEGRGTRYADMAKKRFEKGFDIHVLTARPQEKETVDAIQRFMQKFVGGPAKSVIGVAEMFKGEREPGKRPGTTRQLSTASKKAKVLRRFASQYDQIVFADDNMENYLAGKDLEKEGLRVKSVLAKKFFGGSVQKFATGGIVDGIKNQDTVGALILKPGKDVSSANIQVTNSDIKAKAEKQKKNIDSKIFSNNVKSYNLARSGIKDDTFLESLNEGINQGLTTAIQLASNGVSSLLGLPAINPSPEQTKKLANSINPGARGTIFEEVIANISRNSGGEPFDNRNDPNAPFDFVGSIGKAKDLFENQVAATTKYKDAKASLESAQPKEFLGKIANQIVKEAPLNTLGIQQASLKSNALEDYFAINKTIGQSEALRLLGEKPLKGKQAQNKLASYGLRQTGELKNQSPLYERIGFAKGGAAPSDTVPALLTPGEFVVKKSTAQKVGYGALDRMNKTGQVQGYAKGGVVGMAKGGNPAKAKYKAQRSAERKQATLAQQGLLFTPEDQIDYTKLGGATRQAPKNYLGRGGGKSELRAPGSVVPGTSQGAASPALASAKLSTKTVIELGKRAETLGLDYQAGAVLEKKYLQQRKLGLSREEAYQKALEAATKNLKNRTKAETTAEVKKQPVSINTEAVQKIAQSAQNFIFLAGTASTLAAQFSSLDDASKEAITQTIAFGATLAGTLGTVADVGINIGRSLPAGIKDNLAKGLGAAVPLLTNPIALVAGGIALALGGIIYAYKAYQRALSDQAKKQAQQVASDIEQGKKGVSARDEYIKLEVEAANRMIKSFWISSGVIDNETEARKRAASSYIDTVINLRNLDEQLRAVDADRSLSPLEAASKKIKIQSDSSAASLKILNDASSQLASIFAKTGTKNVQELQSKVGPSQPIVDTAKTALDAFSKNIENNKSAISASLANLQSVFEESSKNFSYDTGAGAASPFEQVLAKSNEFASAFASTKKIVEDSMNSMAISMIQAGQPADQVAEELFKFKSSLMAAERSYIKQAEVNKKAAESTALLNKALRESAQSAFVSGKLRESLSGIAESGKTLSLNLGNINSVIQQEFSAFTLPEVQGLDNLSNIVNFNKFQSELDNIASNFGEFGTNAANEISGVAKVLTASRTLLGREFVGVGDDAGSEAKKAIDDILEPLKGIGGSIGSLRDRARADLEKAAAGGGEQGAVVTQSEIENALSPLKEFVNQNTELFKTFAEEQRNLVSTYAEHIKSLEDSFTREADLRERLAEIEATGAERMAQARDKTLTFQQKDAARLKGTQARLGVAGVNVGAADISGLSKEAIRLQQDLRSLSKEAEANKDNAVKVKQLNEQQGKLKTQLKEVTSALKNMADQGAKAADILADIEKEKAKRETGTKILTDFVTGSLEERGGIMKSFAGLQIAQQTGTLQNFDTDTRKSVVGLLDQLGSVDKRFEELKKNLVFSDAMRMGFDPDTAMKLATATPKEEQLKKALEQTTAQELLATQALIAQEEDNRQAITDNTVVIGSLINDLPGKMTTAISDGYAEFERLRFEKEKESNNLRQKDIDAAKTEQVERAREEAEYAGKLKTAKESAITSLQEFSTALNNAKAGIAQVQPQGANANSLVASEAGKGVINEVTIAAKEAKRKEDEEKQKQKLYMSRARGAGFAKGGTVYAANGALMKPKGTDTVPAMLTPGEFVVRKSSVDKYGVGMMKAINNGQYLADGGIAKNPYYDPDWLDKRFKEKNPGVDSYEEYKNKTINYKDKNSQIMRQLEIESKDRRIAARNEEFKQSQYRIAQMPYDKSLQQPEEAIKKPTGNIINSKGFIKNVTGRGSPEQVRERQKQIQQQQRMGFGGAAYNDPINNTLRNLMSPPQQQRASMGPPSPQEQVRQNQLRIQAQQRGMPMQNVYNPMSSAQGGQDAAMNGFKDFGQQITEAAKMLNGMTMNHTVTVDGMLNVNSAEVAQAVKDSVGNFVVEKIKEILKQPSPFTANGSTPKK